MSSKIKVKTRTGKIVEYPVSKVKNLFKTVGFTGQLLTTATRSLFKEAKGFTKGGVVQAVDLEKAVVKTVNNTNRIAMDTGKKFVKRVLR